VLSAISQHTAEQCGRVSTSLLAQRDSNASTPVLTQMNFTVIYVANIFTSVRKIAKSEYYHRQVCLSAWKNTTSDVRIFTKFGI
jgi:hypothetical protein